MLNYFLFQVAFFTAGLDPKLHPFHSLDISSPRAISSSSSTSSTSSLPSVGGLKKLSPEILREKHHDDVFEDSGPDTSIPETANKRPRTMSSVDMFISSSPESTTGIELTRFFGISPQPEHAILQILHISLTSESNIGKSLI